ncbi:MAG: hypothetical protein SGJ27_28615 [Candidatus Melainabacteria bacterium]|nr:hypothetical protein [Candidatus Melainabacteria bacterium]
MKNTIRIIAASAVLAVVLLSAQSLHCSASPALAASPAAVQTLYEDWSDNKRDRTLPVKIYLPKQIDHPLPVVVFSHGLGGSREAAVYLGNYWAEHGYIGVFMQHPGSDESFWKPTAVLGQTTRQTLMPEFKKTLANPMHALNRAQDVHSIIDKLTELNKTHAQLSGKMDLNAIAIAGHSYGSWTALTASGQNIVTPAGRNISSPDPRVKAAIFLSPTAPKKNQDPDAVFGSIKIPCLHFTGTADSSPVNDTPASDRRVAYDHISNGDQFLVILNDADHMVFNGGRRAVPKQIDSKHHELIEMTTTKFLDAYIKKDSSALQWLRGVGAKNELAGNGTYEYKLAKSPAR